MNIKTLSLVVPAYKQEKTIVLNIESLAETLSKLDCKYEIIVVVDGFLDKTYEKAKKVKNNNVRVLGYKVNLGKGNAVRLGMLEAKGDVIGFMDAGMDIESSSISILLDFIKLHDADIIIGSKLHPDSIVSYPIQRKILSWGYRTFTHLLFGFDVRDTQVGLKFFKKRVVRDVFPRLLVKQFAFDVETLAVAYKLGYTRIYEAPIKLNFRGSGSITSTSFWRVIFWMLWDTAAVFYRLKILHYYDKDKKQ
ncbi:MAG: glycosyltransferase [Patescibacteria group bacterium]